MPWYGWFPVVILAASAIVTVARVGEPREPIKPAEAALVVILDALLIWAVVALAQ